MDSELSQRLHEIAHRGALLPSPVSRYRPPPRRAVREGVLFGAHEPPVPGGNFVVALGTLPPPERILALAAEFFGGTLAGSAITLELGSGDALDETLRARGWPLDEEEPGLVLAPVPRPPPAPAGLVIARVTDEAGLRRFFDTVRAGSVSDEELRTRGHTEGGAEAAAPYPLEQSIPSLAAATDPDVALFVGFVGGAPAATSVMYRYDEVAELIAVTTLPAYRRRGFGTAMTWAAIAEATRRGCEAITLTATPMGYPVYVRMGFVPVCVFRTYVAPESED